MFNIQAEAEMAALLGSFYTASRLLDAWVTDPYFLDAGRIRGVLVCNGTEIDIMRMLNKVDDPETRSSVEVWRRSLTDAENFSQLR